MHYSAYARLSYTTCLSVCDKCELWLLKLTHIENNYTTNYSGIMMQPKAQEPTSRGG